MKPNYSDRIAHLEKLCGLEVRHKLLSSGHHFTFIHNGRDVKQVFTYGKARAFAEGVAIGTDMRSRLV